MVTIAGASARADAGLKTRMASVFCLNMAQGLPGSFFAIGLPALLRESGAGLDMISLAYLVWAPWALKWSWAPLLDGRPGAFGTVFGRIKALPFIMAGAFVLLIAFPPTTFVWPVFAVGLLCAFVGSTLQMVLAGWIIAVEADERNRASLNAAQVAGMITGAMIGGTLIIALSNLLSWTYAVVAVAVLIVLVCLPFLLTQREDGHRGSPRETVSEKGASFGVMTGRLFSRRSFWLLFPLMLLSDLATGVDVLLPARLVDAGYDATQATFLLNTLGLAVTVPLSFLAGVMLRHLTARIALSALFAFKAVILLLLGLGPTPLLTAILAIVSAIASSVAAIAYWQLYMRATDARQSAYDIGVITSLRTCLLMAGGISAGQLSISIGYSGVFFMAAMFSFTAAALATLQHIKKHDEALA